MLTAILTWTLVPGARLVESTGFRASIYLPVIRLGRTGRAPCCRDAYAVERQFFDFIGWQDLSMRTTFDDIHSGTEQCTQCTGAKPSATVAGSGHHVLVPILFAPAA